MSDSLRALSDQELLSRTATLATQERKLTISLLLHLHEVERRRLNLKRGYATLFAYCTVGLGYSAAAAMRRIQAARCIARFSGVHELLESNEINLSTISQVAGILTPENKDTILARIRGKSQREVEAVVAEYEPCAAVPRDRVRTVVVRVPAGLTAAPNFRNGSHNDRELAPGSGAGGEGADTVINSAGPEPRGAREAIGGAQPGEGAACPAGVSGAARLERRTVVQFSAGDAFMAQVEQVRSIASHRLAPNASFEQVFELMMDHFLDDEDPEARHRRRQERPKKASQQERRVEALKQPRREDSSASTRSIPARVRDEVFVRDKRRCTYVGVNGHRCASTHTLQIDHIKPVARGGAATADNLRLLCAHHNRLEAERLMGRRGLRRDPPP